MKTYSAAQRAEAIALARLVGAEEAARRIGYDVQTVRGWSQAAGIAPDLDPDLLEAAHEQALAKVTNEIANGKLTGTRLATVLGIISDKRRRLARDKPKAEPSPNATPASTYVDGIEEGFPALCPDLVARHRGDAVAAFTEVMRAYVVVLDHMPEDAEADLEGFLCTFDPDTFAAEQERAKAEHVARVAELTRASWLRFNGTGPGGRSVVIDPEVLALFAEADAYLETHR